MIPFLERGSLYTRLFLTHLMVIVASTATLLIVTLLTAHTLHDRLMVAMLGSDVAFAADPTMALMEQATNDIFTSAMVQALLISSSTAILVALVASMLLSRRIVWPIQRLLDASRRIAAGHYNERVPVVGNDELAALAVQFNIMADSLESAERRRVALIGDVSHELRTPLATIEGYAEGAIDGIVATNEATWALILDEVSRLRRLVTDLQDLSRAEAKQLSLSPSPVDPRTLVERACARLAPQFAAKGVALRTDIPTFAPAMLVDPDRITQVLINLLGNALQYTPTGGSVTIRVMIEHDAVLFQIQDTGIGISAEHLPHLFERFYRVDKARTRATGGTGIGLTISKALIEAHGGAIWGESDGPGRGATFSFRLPQQNTGHDGKKRQRCIVPVS